MAKKSTRNAISKVKNYTVVQANDLIRNKKDFSLWEYRVFALLTSMVRKDDGDFHTYKFRIKDLLDLFDTNSNNLYEEIRKVPEKLHSKLIRIPYTDESGKKRERKYSLISMSDMPVGEQVDDGEYIMLRFDKDLKPLMLEMGKHFTVYKFYNILKLRSPYIFQLYELLKSEQYRGDKSVDIVMDEFRDILQIPPSYKFGNVRQRILEPAKKQFAEHTDIVFDYTVLKGRGGKAIALRFWIYKNPNAPSRALDEAVETLEVEGQEVPFEEITVFEELYPRVKKWFKEDAFKKLLAGYPEEQIRKAITYTLGRLKKGDKIKNVAGHIVSMSKQTNLFDAAAEDTKKIEEQKKKATEAAAKKAKLEKELKDLYEGLLVKEKAITKAIFIEIPEVEAEIFEIAKNKKYSGYNAEKSQAENMENRMFSAAFHNAVKKKFADRFRNLEKQYQPRIKALKLEIGKL